MRQITKITYTQESDVSEENIYAFHDRFDIAILCRKDNIFFWKCLCSTQMVWYKNYKTIEEAIKNIVLIEEYKQHSCGPIMEFSTLKEFLVWAHFKINP